MLSDDQTRQFREDGYTIARRVLDAAQVAALTDELDGWIEESRGRTANYGETLDGKARFDLEAEPLGPAAPAADPRLRGRRRLPADPIRGALAAQWPHRAWQTRTQGRLVADSNELPQAYRDDWF
jgi:hypothetical protein